jgi:hypothetical protein
MSETKTPTDEELHRYLDELPDLLIDGDDSPIDPRFPDGTFYDYDEGLQATVENAPDGKRYIVKYQKGKGLVRIQELVRGAA